MARMTKEQHNKEATRHGWMAVGGLALLGVAGLFEVSADSLLAATVALIGLDAAAIPVELAADGAVFAFTAWETIQWAFHRSIAGPKRQYRGR